MKSSNVLKAVFCLFLFVLFGSLTVGCQFTGGVVGADGKMVQGINLKLSGDQEFKDALAAQMHPNYRMEQINRFLIECVQSLDGDDCRELLLAQESYRVIERLNSAESEESTPPPDDGE